MTHLDFCLGMIFIFFLHWVGDFYCQTNWMATNKSSSNKALGAHVGVYSLILLIGTFSFTFALINGIMHFIIDYFTSRMTKKLWAEGKVHDFFVVIGIDQFLHTAILILTWAWVYK